MSNKICVYAIAKNEEANAAKWYECVKCADHVVVLDTGSSDRTVEILRSLGATVEEKKYDSFRFDLARNTALDIALRTASDIFFALDMDEFLNPGWEERLRREWNPEVHTRATYDLYLGESPIAGSMNWIHDRSWRWRFPVHEVLERRDGSGTLYHVSRQLDLRGGGLVVRHPDLPELHSAYLPLLETRVAENPDEGDSLAYYLRELMYHGDADAALAFEPKIPFEKLVGNAGAWVCMCLASAHEHAQHHATADALLFRAWTLDPGNRTAPTRLAARLCAEGDPLGAEAVLKRAFALSGTTRPDCLFLDHEDVWLWRMEDWLGVALFQQGKYGEALVHFETALAGANTADARTHVKENIRICKSHLKTP